MERLGTADLGSLLEFVRGVHELRDFDGFVQYTVHALPRLVRADLTTYNEIDPVRGSSDNWLDRPEVNTPEAAATWEAHMAEHPVLAQYLRSGDGRAHAIGEFTSQRQFRQTGLYTEHYRPKELEYVVATFLDNAGGRVVGVGLHRNGHDFDERDRMLVDLVRPHLALARRNALAVTRLRHHAARRSLPELLTFDCAGRIRNASPRAIALLSAYVGTPRGDHLPEDLARWIDASQRQPDDAPRVDAPFVREGYGGTLAVRVVEGTGDRYLLLEEARGRPPDALRANGLTARECDVVTLVTAGQTNAEIATALGIAERTVDKHVEHILQKLGVGNRTAIAAFALEAT